MVHRARQGYVQARTACINRIRGLLAEFGHVLALKADVKGRRIFPIHGRSNFPTRLRTVVV
jgi:transposase